MAPKLDRNKRGRKQKGELTNSPFYKNYSSARLATLIFIIFFNNDFAYNH